MASAIAHDPFTGTLGVMASDLPPDWDEAYMALKEKSLEESHGDYSPRFVAIVWEWSTRELGKDARNMSIVELAQYWYEFA